MNNCRASTSVNDGIFFWYFATLIFDSFSSKVCLRFHPWCFFCQKRSFLVEHIYWKGHCKGHNILKIWGTLFGLKYRSAMQENLAQNFLRSWSFWKQHRKGTAKATPKIEKHLYYTFTKNTWSACNPKQVAVFCKHVLIL